MQFCPFLPIEERFDLLRQNDSYAAIWLELQRKHLIDVNKNIRALSEWRLETSSRGAHFVTATYKDMIDSAGFMTRCGSKNYNRVPNKSASIVTALENKGIASIGKNICTEFGVGTNFTDCINPIYPELSTSGSSNGAAAAVAGGLCDLAVGTDAGGSMRRPAGCCGIFGLKASKSTFQTDGIVPVGETLEAIGFFSRTARDFAYIWDAKGISEVALTSQRPTKQKYSLGIDNSFTTVPCHSDVWDLMSSARDLSQVSSIELSDITLDLLRHRAAGWKIISYELYNYHKEMGLLDRVSYQESTRLTILSGQRITKQEYQDCLAELVTAKRNISHVFLKKGIDAIALPLDSKPPSSIEVDPLPQQTIPNSGTRADYDSLSFTIMANIIDFPAVTLPIAPSSTGGYLALQIIGEIGTERLLADIAVRIEDQAIQSKSDHPLKKAKQDFRSTIGYAAKTI